MDVTRGEIDRLAVDWRTRWEKMPADSLLDELAALMPADLELAVLASAMYGMATHASVFLVERLIRRTLDGVQKGEGVDRPRAAQ